MEGDIRTIIETSDGSHTILSQQLQVSYHSKYGAIQESNHVFLANGLHHVARNTQTIAILEMGFGTGLNALLSFREAYSNGWNLHYTTVEAYPISIEQAKALNYHELLGEPGRPDLLLQLHEQPWDTVECYEGIFTFNKIASRFESLQFPPERFDLVYYDAFAPSAQPELWETEVLRIVYDALKPGGILVTYCAKGAVKRSLKSLGFVIEELPGPPGKREMTRAVKA